ncbi:MAG: NAD+ synthase [Alphaproteobacteria bacterium]|nr:NAD+ synthase [Alphaproteobacteria bacterium]
MTDRLAIALAQLNPTVGDITGNIARLREARNEAASLGADLLVASELVVAGYPPEDLVIRPAFLDAVEAAVQALAAETHAGPALLFGAPWRDQGRVHNAALLLDGGRIAAVRFKHDLPNYGVFDEKRVFTAGPLPGPINFRDVRLGVMVCEDMWTEDVTECLEESGAELLVVLNGSPFETEKLDRRLNLAVARVTESGLPLVYVNQIGGQDELVFDGASFVLDADCALKAQLAGWREEIALTEWTREDGAWHCARARLARPADGLESVYQALVLGLRDYVQKNRFPGVIIGLSGGIDSAITAAIAVDAIGREKVRCVMMPSPFTSRESLEDAEGVAKLLGVQLDLISIEPAMAAFGEMLKDAFGNLPPDTTEENIQARARGITLMALSNKTGSMVVSTGNKSEMSCGYATLYGDMCGGYAILKDVYKTAVFALSRWRNAHRPEGAHGPAGPVMPERVITKPPTAELKPNQTDQDTLPPYDLLDAILERLNERDQGVDETVAEGYDRDMVQRVWRMLLNAEYKRRQAPPGVKITPRSFGRDRRYPIVNAFKR